MRASPFGFTNFSRGLNVLDSPYTLNDGEARDVLNMVSSPRGAIKKRYGSVGLATSSSTSFPVLGVTDSFSRANENPLSNGGKWEAGTGTGGSVGEILTGAWRPPGSPLASPIWNVGEQTNPAVSVEVTGVPFNEVGTFAQYVGVNCCMTKGKKKGYLLKYEMQANELYTIRLSRLKEPGPFILELATITNQSLSVGDSIGISVRGGIVYGWHKSGGVWTKVAEAADATYTKGYSGIEAHDAAAIPVHVGLNNFSTGEQPGSTFPAEEVQSIAKVEVSGTSYLIAAIGTKLYSINPAGEFAEIGAGFTASAANKWSVVQAAIGTRVVKGPAYLSNGVDAPQSWTGAAKNTATTAWTAKAEGEFVETPKAKFLVYLANRVWAAGISGDTSALRFSGFAAVAGEGEKADPTNWPKEDIVWFEKDDGQNITGIGIAGAYLMVFKKHKTWAVYDLNEGENRRVSDSVGCVSHRSIVETPQGTFFLTPDQGVFVTNGTTVKEVSRNVRPILQGTDTNIARAAKVDQLENAAAGYINGHYYLSYVAKDSSTKTLDYDVVLQSWWLHDLGGNQWVVWEPSSLPALYTCPKSTVAGIVKAFAEGVYQDNGVNYTGKPLGQTVTATASYGNTESEAVATWEPAYAELTGWKVTGPGIQSGTTVVSVTNLKVGVTHKAVIILSLPATKTEAAGVLTFSPFSLSCYWVSAWEPFFQYVLRHRINQPQVLKRIRTLFVDGRGQLITLVSRKFNTGLEELKGTVDNADMSEPTSPLTLGTATLETQAARYYALGTSRVWSFGFGNNSAEPLEVDAYACDLTFRKS